METPTTPGAGAGTAMQQLTVYICEQDHWHRQPLYLAILELVRAHGGAGATVLKGVAGYSAAGRTIHTNNLVDVVPNLPVMILVVDTAPRIAALLPHLDEMVGAGGGLITVTDLAVARSLHPDRRAVHGDHLRLRQIMETNVVTVTPDTPVADLLPLLLNKYYKALPVVDAERRVLGMVTDVDLLEKADLGVRLSVLEAVRAQGGAGLDELLREVRAGGKTARDVMGRRPEAVIGPDATVRDAAQQMVQQGVKRLPVVDRERRLLGIVGRLDILKAASHVAPPGGAAGAAPLPAQGRTLGEVMLTEVPTVTADTPLPAVVDRLVGSGGARRVVVIDNAERRHVVGIITDADLVGRVGTPARHGLLEMLREGLSLLGSSAQPPLAATSPGMARDVMTQPVVTAPLEMPIPAAIDLMLSREVKVLPVVDAEGRLLGIANRARLLQALLPPGVASA